MCLVQFVKTGTMPVYIDRRPKYEITDVFRPIVDECLECKKTIRVSLITLRSYFAGCSARYEGIRYLCFGVQPLEVGNKSNIIHPAENQSPDFPPPNH